MMTPEQTRLLEAFEASVLENAVLSRVPQILDKSLPLRHYQRDTIMSPAARARWVEPDRLPLPF